MISNSLKIQNFLQEMEADSALIDLIPSLEALLPSGVKFEMDTWNLMPWVTRKGKAKIYNIIFDKIKNDRLKTLIKIYFLEKRLRFYGLPSSWKTELNSLVYLDITIGLIPIDNITNVHFYEAQDLISSNTKDTASPRYAKFLEVFGRWLSMNLGYNISYISTLQSNYKHGRKADDKDRCNKLIDTKIAIDLLDSLHNEDLSEEDEFYLLIFALLINTGLRINEIATLPKDCLIIEGSKIGLRFFPEKVPKLDIRWIFNDSGEFVKDALNRLIEFTNEGRNAVVQDRQNPRFDWSAIFQNEEATQYFVAKFCHEWTSEPRNYMFNKQGAWFEKEKRYIDIIDLVNKAGSVSQASKNYGCSRSTLTSLLQAQQAALKNQLPTTAKSLSKNIRTSWDTDSRVISIMQLENYADLKIIAKFRKYFLHIIKDARDNYQLKGKVYPLPPYNHSFEEKYIRHIHPVIKSRIGKPILEPEDALLVIKTYQFSNYRSTKCDYTIITDKDIHRWFSGEIRSHGTKNHEDSCFSRLGIIDPKTREIAKFTPHDIRHWLTTYLQEGGMPNDQIALLFNRSPKQNDTYDQTSSKVRLNNMRQAIRDGGAMGHVAETFHLLAEVSRYDAEEYLKACTLQLNLMPHGGCTLNWGISACQNHNACFNGANGLCEHLCIDYKNAETRDELDRMMQETDTALGIIPPQSPQFEHYRNIQKNLQQLHKENNK